MKEELAEFKGGMTENYANTQAGFKPYFWRNDKCTKEVDFKVISQTSRKIQFVECYGGAKYQFIHSLTQKTEVKTGQIRRNPDKQNQS